MLPASEQMEINALEETQQKVGGTNQYKIINLMDFTDQGSLTKMKEKQCSISSGIMQNKVSPSIIGWASLIQKSEF